MKILSAIVAVLGVIAIVMAVIVVLVGPPIMGITGAGYLRGATALLVLALVVMVYDRWYLTKKK